MPKYLLDKAMKGTANFEVKVPTGGGTWSVPEYKVYGRIALGETVTVCDGSTTYRGEVVYVHPQGRFFQIQAKGETWRTSFAFPTTKGEGSPIGSTRRS